MRALRCALTKRPSPGITNLPAAPLASLTASLKSSSKNVVAVFFGVPTFSAMCPTTFVLRSEEHTSELQSRLHLVCRLLLEKKKLPKHVCASFHLRYVFNAVYGVCNGHEFEFVQTARANRPLVASVDLAPVVSW